MVAGQDRVDATARAVVECAADAIVAFSTERTVLLWNPAAERMFGWTAAEVVGREPPLIPEEFQAEHNAVLERVRTGGQISFVTRRSRKDGTLLGLRIATSALRDRDGEVIGWVNVCHRTGADEAADEAVLRLAAGLGGTISAEHGVGRAKARWLPLSRSAAEIDAMRAVKRALDPAGLLNPGVLVG